jgi:hypothetical protein
MIGSLVAFAATAHAGWREDVAAAVASCATAAPEARCAVAEGLHLRTTRAGFLVAQDPALDDVGLVPFLADRLLREDDPAVRRGLADGLLVGLATASPRWDAVWIGLLEHPQSDVRAVLVDGLRRAPLAVAGPGLRAAAAHADPLTRADAARVMGGHADLPTFQADLQGLAADPDEGVRAAAVRSLARAAAR